MEEKIKEFQENKKKYNMAMIFNFIGIVGVIFGTILTIKTLDVVFLILGAIFVIVAIVMLNSSSKNLVVAERQLMLRIWEESYSSEEAKEKMLSLGVRLLYADNFVKYQNKTKKMREMNQRNKKAYEQAYNKCEEILKDANKPTRCNKVKIVDKTNFLYELEVFQYLIEWNVWRNKNRIYFYSPEVECYPTADKDAPFAFFIDVEDIQYFKEEGSIQTELKISGGTINQDKRTGKISQTPISSKTIEHDNRSVILTLNKNSIISKIEFSYASYDVLFALIPEKEYNRVKNA